MVILIYSDEEWSDFAGCNGQLGYLQIDHKRVSQLEEPRPKPESIKVKDRFEDLIL